MAVYDCNLIPNLTLTSSSENFVVSNGFFNNNIHIICTKVFNIFIINFIEKCSLVYNDFISSRNLIGQQCKYYAKSSQNHLMEALDIT